MPKLLEDYEGRKLYYFYSEKSGKRLRKFSGDAVSDRDVSEFEIPDFLLSDSKKEK